MACNGDICNCSTCSNFEPPTEEDLKKIEEEEEIEVYEKTFSVSNYNVIWRAISGQYEVC